jgi:TRAP-type mannitol/chloroaromatic compound transport system substrate-binding protein
LRGLGSVLKEEWEGLSMLRLMYLLDIVVSYYYYSVWFQGAIILVLGVPREQWALLLANVLIGSLSTVICWVCC